MTLEDLGYDVQLEQELKKKHLDQFDIGRVASEHKDRYIVRTEKGDFHAEIIGNLRFSAESREDFPAVGDWVAISEYDEDKVLIHAILPRKTMISRQAVNAQAEKQIIATNVDFALIVQAVDRDFNINRIERYLTICNTAHVEPILILNKVDLIDEATLNLRIEEIKERISQITILPFSNESLSGFEEIKKFFIKGKTYCLLGSSGVGKSSLLNNLSGANIMKTNTVSDSNKKGRHITSHRELFVLKNGGIIIDNPGMREVGIADSSRGLEVTFDQIFALAKTCKFKDCTHVDEHGCSVIEALDEGDLDEASYHNYVKMEKEKSHFESSLAERRKKDKDFGKMVRAMKKNNRSGKH